MAKSKSRKPWGLTHWFLLMFGALLVSLSSGCASKPIPAPQIATPVWLREACNRPDLPQGESPTIGAVLAFTVDQEAALSDCDTRRAQALKLIEDANMIAAGKDPAAKPKRKWWKIG
jgi:hypothetical protein